MRKVTHMKRCTAGTIFLLSILAAWHADVLAQAPPPAYAVSERGPHHRVWQRTVERQLPSGRTVNELHAYTELATGMHYWENGQWLESQETIELLADGAAALRGQHKAVVAANLNTRGSVYLLTPEGKHLTSNVLCLAYVEWDTGRSVSIAEVKDSIGELLPPNQIFYRDAFSDLKADVRFTYTRSALEADVILRQLPPSPEVFDFNPASTRLEVWTEYVQAPIPTKETRVLDLDSGGVVITGPPLTDDQLSFGVMALNPGGAFLDGLGAGSGGVAEDAVRVGKSWQQTDGRTFLIEAVEYPRIKAKLEEARLESAAIPSKSRMAAVKPGRVFPPVLQMALAKPLDRRPKMAKIASAPELAALNSEPGFVLDWQQVNNGTNTMVFASDQTYYISGSVTLSGNSVLCGGAVLKFTNSSSSVQLSVQSTLECSTSPSRPAVLTGKDDDSIGEVIAGSTGALVGYYGYFPLYCMATTTNYYNLHDLRFRNGQYTLAAAAATPPISMDLANLQFADCKYALRPQGGRWNVRNLLVKGGLSAFRMSTSGTNNVEHGTFDGVTNLVDLGSGSVNLTNCLLVGSITNTNYVGACIAVMPPGSNVFQTVGAGSHYLATNSPHRDAGTNTLSPAMLSILQQSTTFPPILLTNSITTSTTLTQVVSRDTSVPDLGYHYPAIDFAVSNLTLVSNSTLTIAPGVAIAVFGGVGIWLQDNSTLVSEGQATRRNLFAPYNTFQENNILWPLGETIAASWSASTNPSIQLRFTDFTAMSGSGIDHVLADLNYDGTQNPSAWSVRDCGFYGARVEFFAPAVMNFGFTNNLFERVEAWFGGSMQLSLFNNLFISGSWILDPDPEVVFEVRDNVFDANWVGAPEGMLHSHNAYVRMADPNYRLSPTNANDVVLGSFNYAKGFLGDYYQLSTNLCDAGSGNATNAGLYHFTTTTNQWKETNGVVDIGLHYVALDANGLPADNDGDGIPDYLEDKNGDGAYNNAETRWTSDDPDYDGVNSADEASAGTNPLDPASVPLLRLGHWRFDTAEFRGDEGQMPIGTYLVTNAPSWSSNAVRFGTNYLFATNDYAYKLAYRDVEDNLKANINCRNGTVRFWFKPEWTSASLGGTGPQSTARLIDVLDIDWVPSMDIHAVWQLHFNTDGNSVSFLSISNGIWAVYLDRLPVALYSNHWYQFALTYSPSNVAFYNNGVLAGTSQSVPTNSNNGACYYIASQGIYNWPAEAGRQSGFGVGSTPPNDGTCYPLWGQMEELETFNYPLSGPEIARGFPNFGSTNSDLTLDTDYDGRSDLLELHVDGTDPNDSTKLASNRLAYFRFNDTNYFGEQGQSPLFGYGVNQTSSWSGSALVVDGSTNSGLIYRDVETNGWANFCARRGAVRFWFKPHWSSGYGPAPGTFMYIGNPTNPAVGAWDFRVSASSLLNLVTSFSGAVRTNLTASYFFVSNHWNQITLNWNTNATELYINGQAVTTNGTGVEWWPARQDRTDGLVLGNNHAGTQCIRGQFEEVETFNYTLTATEISRNFALVKTVDSDLNGTADLLEDIHLGTNRPFMGTPFVVTGVIEAEQFDAGGPGIAYSNAVANPACDYRTTGMFITNCDDFGGGYCVDQTRAGDWMKYTLDVRVGQTYWIEPRVVGIGSNGVFTIEFCTNGSATPYTETGNFTITSTNWSNLRSNVTLAAGTNVMRVRLVSNGLVNGSDSGGVGKFNYISIYPSWQEGFSGPVCSNMVTGVTNNDSGWIAASNNAYQIQAALNSLVSDPGCTNNAYLLTIPQGTFYVAPAVPDEAENAELNAVLVIPSSNIEIRGAGKTNTTLIAYNRATTIIHIGSEAVPNSMSNIILRGLTMEARPHLISTNAGGSNGFINYYELGALADGAHKNLGALVTSTVNRFAYPARNLLIEDCRFRNADRALFFPDQGPAANCLIRSNEFICWDGTNGSYTGGVNSPASPNTTNGPWTSASICGQQGSPNKNVCIVDNIYNGNPSLTNLTTDNGYNGPDGLVWIQGGGNWFVARNCITNYRLEAVQFNAGPAGVVQNTFQTVIQHGSSCALNGFASQTNITGQSADYFFSFVGNCVAGGRFGWIGTHGDGFLSSLRPYRVNACGNRIAVEKPLDSGGDWPGGVATLFHADGVNISGNTLLSGGLGLGLQYRCTNVVVLKNDFAAVQFAGIDDHASAGTLNSVVLVRNTIGQGVNYHLKLPFADSFGHFLLQNRFVNSATNTVTPFLDAAAAPVHFVP